MLAGIDSVKKEKTKAEENNYGRKELSLKRPTNQQKNRRTGGIAPQLLLTWAPLAGDSTPTDRMSVPIAHLDVQGSFSKGT
jgi:hypothetical protein